MNPDASEKRAPFAEQTETTNKRRAGATPASETPVEIRGVGLIDPTLRDWVHESLGRHLGKYARQIERVEVRFGDVNGSKGGIDRVCMVHLIVSALPPVVAEERSGEDRQAFDLAVATAERALRHSLGKHGFSAKR